MNAKVRLFAVEDDRIRPLPVADRVTNFDQLYDGLELGVYSALRTFSHNKFLYLAEHIQRTQTSMAVLGWAETLNESRLRRALHEVCTQFPAPEARVRFDFLAAPPLHFGSPSRLLIGLIPFTPPSASLYQVGVQVGFTHDLVREHPLAKTAVFAQKRQKYRVADAIYEYLLLNEQNYILEGTGSNFYGVLDGALHTAGTGVLAGITRRIILDLAAEQHIPASLTPIHMEEIPLLTEAALSSSSRGLLPIVKIGEQVVGNGRPGPICQQLLTAYNDFVAREVKTAV